MSRIGDTNIVINITKLAYSSSQTCLLIRSPSDYVSFHVANAKMKIPTGVLKVSLIQRAIKNEISTHLHECRKRRFRLRRKAIASVTFECKMHDETRVVQDRAWLESRIFRVSSRYRKRRITVNSSRDTNDTANRWFFRRGRPSEIIEIVLSAGSAVTCVFFILGWQTTSFLLIISDLLALTCQGYIIITVGRSWNV